MRTCVSASRSLKKVGFPDAGIPVRNTASAVHTLIVASSPLLQVDEVDPHRLAGFALMPNGELVFTGGEFQHR